MVDTLQVGLVHGKDVGDLQDAGLDGLDVVAQPRHFDDDGGVRGAGDIYLSLARAKRRRDENAVLEQKENPQGSHRCV